MIDWTKTLEALIHAELVLRKADAACVAGRSKRNLYRQVRPCSAPLASVRSRINMVRACIAGEIAHSKSI